MRARETLAVTIPCRISLFNFIPSSQSTRPRVVVRASNSNKESLSTLSASDEAILEELEKREGFRRELRLNRQIKLKKARKAYQLAAGASTLLLIGLASGATYLKFVYNQPIDSSFPWMEFSTTLLLVACGTAGMEMYARWAHRVWWHEMPSGWALHKSHHSPRTSTFEANDIYAIANAVPAFALCFYGFFQSGIVGSLAFGMGLGITLFGIAYMFVHDGLVHKRFPVGPLANLPFMKKVAAAHMIHHSDKYDGKPYGMFLGPQEIADIPEAVEEMNKLASLL